MGWQAYRLVYQAKSPLHIGYRTLGFIQRTRYYIPGRALWGAITANITRAYFLSVPSDNLQKIYDYVGKEVTKHIKLSYFYPALEPDNPLLPRFTSNGLQFTDPDQKECRTQEEFEATFIHSYGQTAVEPQTVTAEYGSIHETEFISPVVEDGDQQKPVFFVGYIVIDQGNEIEANGVKKTIQWESKGSSNYISLEAILQEIFVGGERKYGFGRLCLVEQESGPLRKDKDGNWRLFSNKLIFPDNVPKLDIEKGDPTPAHLGISSCTNLKGDIEPLVGREWGDVDSNGNKKAGAGQKISSATLCWVPGSIMLDSTKTLKIADYGLLI